jgi:uncharacterized protein (TIGR00251 family)
MSGAAVVTPVPGGVRIALRVMPRSSRTTIDGVRDGRLVVRVTAPPVDGAANEAVIQAIARRLDLPVRAVTITGGDSGRNKTLVVAGIDEARARARLLGG